METKDGKNWNFEEVIRKYNIPVEKLKKEQISLAKNLKIKDEIDFSRLSKIGGISNLFFQNRIVSVCVVLNSDFEIIEQKYFESKLNFPYLPGFRAYRELPAMISCFQKLDEKPEVVFIEGEGIVSERLGLASHFSLASGVPTIGIADELSVGELKGEDIIFNNKIMGKVVQTKIGSKPLYVSSGNLISLDSLVKLVKKFVKEPHKMPEPIRLAHKYGKEVFKELYAPAGN